MLYNSNNPFKTDLICKIPSVSFSLSKNLLQCNQVHCETTHLAQPGPYINPARAHQGIKSHTVQLSLTMSCLPFMLHLLHCEQEQEQQSKHCKASPSKDTAAA